MCLHMHVWNKRKYRKVHNKNLPFTKVKHRIFITILVDQSSMFPAAAPKNDLLFVLFLG